MRWLSFLREGAPSFGYVTADGAGVVDAGARYGHADLKSAIAAGALADLAKNLGDSADLPLAGLTYAPTIPNPDKILCVGLNYRAHQEETGRGGEAPPTIFVRFAAAQVGHEQAMLRPRESAALDYEGEIALIIGRPPGVSANRRRWTMLRASASTTTAAYGTTSVTHPSSRPARTSWTLAVSALG